MPNAQSKYMDKMSVRILVLDQEDQAEDPRSKDTIYPIAPTPSSTMVHRTITGSVIVLWET
jgi:hypothetical protein